MRNTQKFTLVCCCMIGAGVLLSGVGYAMGGRVWGIGIRSEGLWVNTPNVSGKGAPSYVEETRELEEFSDMDIDLDFGELTIEPSDHFGISYCVESGYDYSVEVEDGCLTIKEKYPPAFGGMENLVGGNFVVFGVGNTGMSAKDEYVKIYVPVNTNFDMVKLNSDYGKVAAKDLSAKELVLHADFGDVNLEGLESEKADISLGGGKLELMGFADGDLNVENDFGKTILRNITAGNITITMESGDLEMSVMEAASLTVNQAFGEIRLEDAQLDSTVVLYDESGDIDLTNLSAESLQVTNEFGNVEGERTNIKEGNFTLESGSCDLTGLCAANLEITSDFGNVKLELTEPVETYTLELATEFGNVKINRRDMGVAYKSLETRSKSIVVNCDSGDITIREED